jgi:mannitol-specific phosphotransferase system IIBC component
MTSCCDNQNNDCGSNSGFILGLLCGAIIGAVVAILIYKNNKTEVFEKLSQKIKYFFDNLIQSKSNKPAKHTTPKTKISPKKILANSTNVLSKPEITPIFVKPKKPIPKTFIKPKK